MCGRVDRYLRSRLSDGPLHFTLIDPDKAFELGMNVRDLGRRMVDAGTDAFLVGGSVGVSETDVDRVVKELKGLGVPVILFPGNVSGISRHADAILFLSLLNSDDPYFIIGAQVLAAPIVVRYGLEAIPTAYIIVGYGGAAGHVGRARPIPYEKPELGAAYALAAKLMGMKYVYLEAGSGSPKPIPPAFIERVSRIKNGDLILIVGGGIRKPDQARKAVESGADILVTGTIIEEKPNEAEELIRAIKRR